MGFHDHIVKYCKYHRCPFARPRLYWHIIGIDYNFLPMQLFNSNIKRLSYIECRRHLAAIRIIAFEVKGFQALAMPVLQIIIEYKAPLHISSVTYDQYLPCIL